MSAFSCPARRREALRCSLRLLRRLSSRPHNSEPSKLKNLAGYGSTAAFCQRPARSLSSSSILIFGFPIFNAVPSDLSCLPGLGFVRRCGSGWRHSRSWCSTSSGWSIPPRAQRSSRVAHWATLVSVLPVLFGIAVITNAATLGTIVVSVLALLSGSASSSTTSTREARLRLLKGSLPWIGVSGCQLTFCSP